jgi:hypothetical protein
MPVTNRHSAAWLTAPDDATRGFMNNSCHTEVIKGISTFIPGCMGGAVRGKIGCTCKTELRIAGKSKKMESNMQELIDTLTKTDKEFTSAPYWLIIDMNNKTEISDIREVATMITGPFFSRKDAQDYLDARRSNFSDNARVYCKSGHASSKYARLWKWIEERT